VSKTSLGPQRWPINRRAFLRGATGVALGLPFLESLPERSAWAAGHAPVFSLFICAVDGIVPQKFFPNALGELTSDGLAAAGKATSILAPHANNLLFVRGISWPGEHTGDAHAQSLAMALTALPSVGSSNTATSTGPSADWVIAAKVQAGTPPLTLYAGRKAGYINEKLSFSAAGTVTAASNNPYELYQKLVGIVSRDGTPAPGAEEAKRLLFESRKSIHDLVRDDLRALMGNSRMSSADRQRLQQHFDSIRDVEITMDGMGDEMVRGCAWGGVEISKLEALKTFVYNDRNGMIEDVARLQMSLVALAFACNYNRTATLQWGDGTDGTIYPVPSNESLQWRFNYICHRAQSDSATGDNPTAALAHAEIDVLRMKTLTAGLDHFKARGLEDKSFVLWTNAIADCPSDSFKNVPVIVWGDGGGYLKQGAYVDAGNTTNSPLLNALISAAIQDTGETMETFGGGPNGQLAVVLA
jgi:hypothetical protein